MKFVLHRHVGGVLEEACAALHPLMLKEGCQPSLS